MTTKALSNGKSRGARKVAPLPPAPKSREKFTYALTPWTVEIRSDGWYACESGAPHFGPAPKWIGPYPDLSSATLAIGSKLRSEAFARHKRQAEYYRLARTDPLYGLSRVQQS